MKWMYLFLLLSLPTWGKPIVLIGHFDPFDKDLANNSEIVSKLLLEKSINQEEFDLRICSLNTVFDKSFYQLENCLKALPELPVLVLGLGESNCNLKIEMLGRNIDKTYGPDNEGIERHKKVIIPDAPAALGFTYPLAQMYCALNPNDRKAIEVSNNAGSFVCNNLAFQFSYQYPDLSFGFIHVPAHHCKSLERKTNKSVENLEKMILAAVKTKLVTPLPIYESEIKAIRSIVKKDKCQLEFYKRTKGIDEKGQKRF